jgi:hypothetical protein
VHGEEQVLRLCCKHESWEDNIIKKEQWARIDIDKKRWIVVHWEGFFEQSEYCSTGVSRTSLFLMTMFPGMSFTYSACTAGLKLLNL